MTTCPACPEDIPSIGSYGTWYGKELRDSGEHPRCRGGVREDPGDIETPEGAPEPIARDGKAAAAWTGTSWENGKGCPNVGLPV